MDSLLDERLRGLADISAMVMELLEIILRNLHRSRSNHGHVRTLLSVDGSLTYVMVL